MSYEPKQGDIILLEFDPQAGHEQKGKKPALIISNNTYNNFLNIALVCPITRTDRKFPLHVSLDNDLNTKGFIMCEQVKALDIKARNAVYFERVSKEIIDEVVDIVIGFIE
ncbi:MAG: type II toxin-antitoxin system PemK/MazF family toxin [Eubacteriales bacterium]